MPTERTETLIVGGGQSGLVMSHMLSKRGSPHLVLERHRIAERWRSERWDGLRFQFPNWSVELPDFPFPHADPHGFATVTEIVDYIAAYATFVAAPVRCGVEVTRLRRDGGAGFVAETSDGSIEAANVVVATGPYQRPIMPSVALDDTRVFQVHANSYKAPGQLPAGPVLVVGAGASGTQIAEELVDAGRKVYLSVGHHRRLPRRYRGRDLIWWLTALGLDKTPPEERGPDRSLPLITGANGGYTIDFRQIAGRGVTLLGKLGAARDGVMEFADDLAASLAYGDAAYRGFMDTADVHIERHKLAMPPEPAAHTSLPDPACVTDPMRRLDLKAAGISALIWATGYGYDYGWIDMPVLDAMGEPRHHRGVAEVPGLYFLGLQWLTKRTSSFLSGIGDDAAALADHICARDQQIRSQGSVIRDQAMGQKSR
jgi:putative flavoprotein involved in K+ transport